MLIQKMVNFHRSENGATAIEYAVIATLLGMACVVSLQFMGTTLRTTFEDILPFLSV